MAETLELVVLAGAILILIPVLLTPAGWLTGLVLVVLWVGGVYGIRWLMGLEKWRRSGERAKIHEIRASREDDGGRRR